MDQQFDVAMESAPERLFPLLADLGRYHQFLDIVHRVEPASDGDSTTDLDPDSGPAGDPRPAWLVTLRAKIGPFSRSKRLRMVRTELDEPKRVRFERSELDGRQHSTWTLSVDLEPSGTGSRLTMGLAYGGSLWSSALDGLLQGQVERAGVRLDELASSD